LYLVFEGKDPDTQQPIIKAFLNPLIAWIWIGVLIVVAGTFIALVPNLTRNPVRLRQEDAASIASAGPALGEVGVVAKVGNA
jgi:cytochrome c-type biogenesis protein CcmF